MLVNRMYCCLLITYAMSKFPTDNIPTVFDCYTHNVIIDGINVGVSLWDTMGNEDYDKLRPLSFPQTDVFLVCFSIVDHTSFQEVRDKWCAPDCYIPRGGPYPLGWQSIKHFCPGTPFILVGTKEDLRTDRGILEKFAKSGLKPITHEQGQELAKQIGAAKYMECSALTQLGGVKEIFEEAIRVVLSAPAMAKKLKSARLEAPPPINPGVLHVSIVKASNLRPADTNGLSDPFVKIGTYHDIDGDFDVLKKGKVIKETLNPEWNEEFEIELVAGNTRETSGIRIQVWDQDFISNDFLGQCSFSWSSVKESVNTTAQLVERKGKKEDVIGTLTLKIKYTQKH